MTALIIVSLIVSFGHCNWSKPARVLLADPMKSKVVKGRFSRPMQLRRNGQVKQSAYTRAVIRLSIAGTLSVAYVSGDSTQHEQWIVDGNFQVVSDNGYGAILFRANGEYLTRFGVADRNKVWWHFLPDDETEAAELVAAIQRKGGEKVQLGLPKAEQAYQKAKKEYRIAVDGLEKW